MIIQYLIWNSFVILSFFYTKLWLKKINCCCLSKCLSKCFNMDNGSCYVKDDNTDRQKEAWSILLTIIYSNLIKWKYIFSDYYSFIGSLLGILIVIPLFALLGQAKGLQTSCSRNSTWPWQSKVTYSILGIIMIGSIVVNIYIMIIVNDNYLDKLINYCVMVIYNICIVLLLYFYSGKNIHMHHWSIGLTMSLLTSENYWIINILRATYFGLVIEEAAVYSLESIFD